MQGDAGRLQELPAEARSVLAEGTEDKGQNAFGLHGFV